MTIQKRSTTKSGSGMETHRPLAITTSGGCRRRTTTIRCTSQFRYICHRPVFVNTAGEAAAKISPNLAGRMAAALAECYQIFKTSNPSYANQCLLSAEHIFDLADTSPSGNLLSVAPFSFYPETEWRDDLELGATELYFALQPGNLPPGLPHIDPVFYLTEAANWAHAYITGPNDAADTLNLYDVTGLAHFELHRALGLAGNPTGLAVTQSTLLADLKKQLDNAVTQSGMDPFGFGFPWAAYDTTTHGNGLVVMAQEYDFLTGTNTYAAYGSRWQANVRGPTLGEPRLSWMTAAPSLTACNTKWRIWLGHRMARRPCSRARSSKARIPSRPKGL